MLTVAASARARIVLALRATFILPPLPKKYAGPLKGAGAPFVILSTQTISLYSF